MNKPKKDLNDFPNGEATKPEVKQNPWSRANPVSLLFFAWMWPIFKKGWKTGLEPTDLFPTPDVYCSDDLVEKLEIEWNKEIKASGKTGKVPSLFWSIVRICKRNLILYWAVLTFDELIIRVAIPIVVRLFTKSFQADSKISRREQIIYGGVLCVCLFIHNYIIQHCMHLMMRTGLMCRVSLSTLLYKKILKLSQFSRKEASTGKLTNLMANDLSRLEFGLIYIGYAVIAPVQVLIFIYFLWEEVYWATFGGIAMVAFILPLQVVNGTWITIFRDKIAKLTDERSRLMNEIIMAVRVIKMMAWEGPFAQLIMKIRRMEVTAVGKKLYLTGIYLSLFTVCIKLTPFLSILWYVLSGYRITADKAFFMVAIFQIIIENMVYYFSIGVASVGEIWISIGRLQEVLLMEEQKSNFIDNGRYSHLPEGVDDQGRVAISKDLISIQMVNASATWSPDDPIEQRIVNNFNLDVGGDKLVMIVGAVGSGKSSFLQTLVSELPISSGSLKVNGSISYAVQEPWLFSGTIRENVLFGKEFNERLYKEIIHVTALKEDLRQFPNGDLTVVGERGMALSGGQKARVNLARALYKEADIVLLDDILSAVDSRVSKLIFDKCVMKHLRGKLRILATHQLQYLPFADWIVVLKKGEIFSQGTPAEIQAMELDITELITEEEDESRNRPVSSYSVVSEPTPPSSPVTKHAPYEEIPNVDEEDWQDSPVVSYKTYWKYLRMGNSPSGLILMFLVYAVCQVILTLTEYWLSLWTSAGETAQKESREPIPFLEPYWGILYSSNYYGDDTYLAIYGGLIGLVLLLELCRVVACFWYFIQISINLHDKMFQSLIRAPIKFFEENPSGRIMNRFTKDIGSIDEVLPVDIFDSIDCILQCFGLVVIIILTNYFLTIPTFLVILVVIFIWHVFIKTSRELKRIEAQARSPVFSHLATSIQGITTIRSLNCEDDAINKFAVVQDAHTAAWFLFISSTRFFTTWIATISGILLISIIITFIIIADDVDGGLVGFIVTSTILLATSLQWTLRVAAEAENNMTSVARALKYTEIPSEANWEGEKPPPSTWPHSGAISFNSVCLAYGDIDVLKSITFNIKPKEKIGIVGRTGAGKSTIIAALFRMTEPHGEIIIDGVKINKIGLHNLRKMISIIPQDPVLFSGSIRKNLDPFGQFEDEEVWRALEDVQLNDKVTVLDAPVEDGGANFSIGQRQLICLARAILRKNRIIVMDEATANVDVATDAFIQTTIREKFKDCTIIIIAHRLQTVMDCDKILVLENGSLMEYDHPHLLIEKQGYLAQLVSYTGENVSAQLKDIAKCHYFANHKDGDNVPEGKKNS